MKTQTFTRVQRRDIRSLVTAMCANYSERDKLCLPADAPCYMLGKETNNGHICEYFKKSVLPLNPILESLLLSKLINSTKPCAICGKQFISAGRQIYCSGECQETGARIKERAKKQKQREKKRLNVPI